MTIWYVLIGYFGYLCYYLRMSKYLVVYSTRDFLGRIKAITKIIQQFPDTGIAMITATAVNTKDSQLPDRNAKLKQTNNYFCVSVRSNMCKIGRAVWKYSYRRILVIQEIQMLQQQPFYLEFSRPNRERERERERFSFMMEANRSCVEPQRLEGHRLLPIKWNNRLERLNLNELSHQGWKWTVFTQRNMLTIPDSHLNLIDFTSLFWRHHIFLKRGRGGKFLITGAIPCFRMFGKVLGNSVHYIWEANIP